MCRPRYSKRRAVLRGTALNDVSTLTKRLDALRELATVPELERQAAELRVPLPSPFLQPLTDFASVEEVAKAIDAFRSQSDELNVSPRKVRSQELRMEARTAESSALSLLAATADPAIGEEIREHTAAVQRLQGFIATREEDLNRVDVANRQNAGEDRACPCIARRRQGPIAQGRTCRPDCRA